MVSILFVGGKRLYKTPLVFLFHKNRKDILGKMFDSNDLKLFFSMRVMFVLIRLPTISVTTLWLAFFRIKSSAVLCLGKAIFGGVGGGNFLK